MKNAVSNVNLIKVDLVKFQRLEALEIIEKMHKYR